MSTRVTFPDLIPRWLIDRALATAGIKLQTSWHDPRDYVAVISGEGYAAMAEETKAAVSTAEFQARQDLLARGVEP